MAVAMRMVREAGYQLQNLDCIVFAQQPKLSPYKSAIAARMAEILGVPADQIGIKAKTGEHVGPVGRGEAMMAECVCLIESKPT